MLSQLPGIVTLSGGPDIKVVIPETCQPPRIALAGPATIQEVPPFPKRQFVDIANYEPVTSVDIRMASLELSSDHLRFH